MGSDRVIEDAEGNLVIQQSLASKLDSIQAGVTRIDTTLATKADKADMARVDSDLIEVKTRLGIVESRINDDEMERAARFTRKEKVWGGIGAVTLICATVGGPLIAASVH